MKRLLTLLSLLTLGLVLLVPSVPARAENDQWSDVLRAFKENFKTKNSLKERRKALHELSNSHDGRGVKELLKVVKTQRRYAEKLRKEWSKEEAAWEEKTAKMWKNVKTAGNSYTPGGEEDEWLGLSDKYRQQPSKGAIEKNRIEGLYKDVIAEDDAVEYIFKCAARLLNSLEGDEYQKALHDATSASHGASDEDKGYFISMFSYIKGDDATDALASFADDTNPQVVMLALEGLGRQNQEKGIDILIGRLTDPRWQVRASAIRGLSYYHSVRVMDALLEAVKKEEGEVQRKYFAAMARILQEQLPGTVEAWASFWKENRDDFQKRWAQLPKNEPVEGEPPDIPIDTSLGSTSFYGIHTNSKHIIFVVDISGSMGPESGKNDQGKARIDVARDELKGAIKSLSASEEDERGAASFNIILFNDEVTVYKERRMITATVKNKEKAFKWIDENVKAGGQTNIYDALEQAFNIISEKDSKNMEKGADTIFLISDGSPNMGKFSDPELILHEIKAMNKTRKITIHTIGVGKGHNAPFMRALAAENDGQYLSR